MNFRELGAVLALSLLVISSCRSSQRTCSLASEALAADGCAHTWTCEGETFEILCADSGNGYDCSCMNNGRDEASFSSADMCMPQANVWRQGHVGCAWYELRRDEDFGE